MGKVTISEIDSGVKILMIEDTLLREEGLIREIESEIMRVIEQCGDPKVILDFLNVKHMSSAALGALINIKREIDAAGGQLRLSNIDANIYKIFEITRLHQVFAIHESNEAAVGSIS